MSVNAVLPPQPFDLPDLVEDVWAADQLGYDGAEHDLLLYKAKGLFKNDYLAYCKILGVRPHPQLLPLLPPVEPPKTDLPSSRLQSRRTARFHTDVGITDDKAEADSARVQHFDFQVLDHATVRGMLFGQSDLVASLAALRPCTHITRLVLCRTALDSRAIFDLAMALPHTSVRDLVLEFNPLPYDGPEAKKKERVHIPAGCAPLPFALYPGEFAPEQEPAEEENEKEEKTEAGSRAHSRSGPKPVYGSRSRASIDGHDQSESKRSSSKSPSRNVGGSRRASTAQQATTYGLPGKSRARVFSLLARKFQKLESLSLRGNEMGPDEARALGDALIHNTRLTALTLSHNPLRDEGVTALFTGLQEHFGSLAFLGLACTGCTAAVLPSLSSAVTACTLSVEGMKARAALENRVVADLVVDVNGLGLRDALLPVFKAELDAINAAEAAAVTARMEAAAAAAPPPEVKGKGGKAAPAPAPAPVPTSPAKKEEGSSAQTHAAHPDATMLSLFRFRVPVETTLHRAQACGDEHANAEEAAAASQATALPKPVSPAKPPSQSSSPTPASRVGAEVVAQGAHADATIPRTFVLCGNRSLKQLDITGNLLGSAGIRHLADSLLAARPAISHSAPNTSRSVTTDGGLGSGAAAPAGDAAVPPSALAHISAFYCGGDLTLLPSDESRAEVRARIAADNGATQVIDPFVVSERAGQAAAMAAAQAELEAVGIILLL